MVPGVQQVAAGLVGSGDRAGRGALGCPGAELHGGGEKDHPSRASHSL